MNQRTQNKVGTPSRGTTTAPPLADFHDETWHTPKGKLIREVVFGMNDGLITTIGFIAGVHLSLKDPAMVLLAVNAEVFAGTISMALGAYLSTKSQREFFQREIDRERREIEEEPEREAQEIRDIYRAKGFTDEEIEIIVRRITADKDRFLDFMLKEELGLVQENLDNPWTVAGVMGVSFFVGGFIPLLPLLIPFIPNPLPYSLGASFLALFGLGWGKARLARRNPLLGGVEILVLGSIAVALGFVLGKAVALF